LPEIVLSSFPVIVPAPKKTTPLGISLVDAFKILFFILLLQASSVNENTVLLSFSCINSKYCPLPLKFPSKVTKSASINLIRSLLFAVAQVNVLFTAVVGSIVTVKSEPLI